MSLCIQIQCITGWDHSGEHYKRDKIAPDLLMGCSKLLAATKPQEDQVRVSHTVISSFGIRITSHDSLTMQRFYRPNEGTVGVDRPVVRSSILHRKDSDG